LRKLDCSYNKLTGLKTFSGTPLVELACHNNLLTDLDFLDELRSQELTHLNLAGNNFDEQDLSSFSKFSKLEEL
jgi:Leucine-rich repeat (LRR) protein